MFSWLRLQSQLHVSLYRLSTGRVGGRVFGAPVLLLTTVGRKTGKKRTTPLLYLEDNGNLIVAASNGGRDKHPTWFFNARQDRTVEVQVRNIKRMMKAEQCNKDEKERLWPSLVKMYSRYEDYQRKTSRNIPVVVLRPSKEEARQPK